MRNERGETLNIQPPVNYAGTPGAVVVPAGAFASRGVPAFYPQINNLTRLAAILKGLGFAPGRAAEIVEEAKVWDRIQTNKGN